jgi:hypothetical protein
MLSLRQSLSERIIRAALDMIREQKRELCAIVGSEQSTPKAKCAALVVLAHMTGSA